MLRYADDGKKGKEEEIRQPEYYHDLGKNVSWYHKVLLNKPLKVGLVFLLLAVIAPTLVFYFCMERYYFKMTVDDHLSIGSCSHESRDRMPCGFPNITIEACEKQCCYDYVNFKCYQRLPSRYSYIRPEEKWQADIEQKVDLRDISKVVMRPRQEYSPYGNMRNLRELQLYANDYTARHVEFILYDRTLMSLPNEDNAIPDKEFIYFAYHPEFILEIKSTNANVSIPLLTTSRGPLIAARNLWEWTFYLGNETLLGLGEFNMRANRGKLYYNRNEQTSLIPFIMGRGTESHHAVYFDHNGPMEFIKFESNVVNVKSYAGFSLSMHFFYGPTPKDLLREVYQHFKDPIPPYWTLGVHFCRGSRTRDLDQAVTNFNSFMSNANADKLPYESDCIIDELFQFINQDLSTTERGKIQGSIDALLENQRKFLPSIRPHVRVDNKSEAYNSAVDKRLLMMRPDEDVEYVGRLFNADVVYPDYSLQATKDWLTMFWTFSEFSSSFILKDNWPKNELRASSCDITLPYVSQIMNASFCESLSWNLKKPTNDSHFYNHNTYGANFSRSVNEIDANMFLLSSSNVLGSGVGFHVQDVHTSWDSFKENFKHIVANSMSGVRIQGAPVCGDSSTSSAVDLEKLCIRWYQASAYLPIFYVESNSISRHPFAFSPFARTVLVNTIKNRYKLLPYFYTVMNSDEPLIRGLFFDFYGQNISASIEEQYMVGDAVMIAPIFNDRPSTIDVYFPPGHVWFNLWNGLKVPLNESRWMKIATLDTHIPAYIRGGYIIPVQETEDSTAEKIRLNSPYKLIIALNCTESECTALGKLSVVENYFVQFNSTLDNLTISLNLTDIQPYMCGALKLSSSIIGDISIYGKTPDENPLVINLNKDLCEITSGEFIYTY